MQKKKFSIEIVFCCLLVKLSLNHNLLKIVSPLVYKLVCKVYKFRWLPVHGGAEGEVREHGAEHHDALGQCREVPEYLEEDE